MEAIIEESQLRFQGMFVLAPKGFKSVTLSQDTYDFFYEKYKRNRVALRRQGIRSFSAYLSYELFLADDLERQKSGSRKTGRLSSRKSVVRDR
jgi:hypothetical protein